MQDRLNFFEPWERLPANHENQLTRALLVVLRYCPIAHQAWLSRIDATASSPLDPKLTLHSLSSPTFDTQRAQILRESQPNTNEPIKGISVLCAVDVSTEVQSAVMESNRGQVLDGVVRYGDDAVIVLESKIKVGLVDSSQAININLGGQPIQFDGPVRNISWRDILADFIDLTNQERRLVSGAEREILNDFLDFVARNFPELGPFNTLERCSGEPSRVGRRLDVVLNEILDTDGKTLPGIHT